MHKTDKNKDKIRICPFATIITLMLFLLSLVCFVLPWLEKGGPNESFTNTVFFVLLVFLFLTFCLFIWGFIIGWAVVIIDEKGLHKSLLRVFFKKTILWHEIKFVRNIRRIGTIAMWTFFSKSDIMGLSITRCTLRRDNISIMYSTKLGDLVSKYSNIAIKHSGTE